MKKPRSTLVNSNAIVLIERGSSNIWSDGTGYADVSSLEISDKPVWCMSCCLVAFPDPGVDDAVCPQALDVGRGGTAGSGGMTWTLTNIPRADARLYGITARGMFLVSL